MNRQVKADLTLLLITFFWGVANLVCDYAMQTVTPIQLSASRFIIAFIIAVIALRKSLRGVTKDTVNGAAIVGFLLAACYIFAMYGIIHSRSIATFSFIIALPVVMNPVINWLFRGLKPQRKFLFSLAICLSGLVLLNMVGGSLAFGFGEFLAMLSALCYSVDLCYTDVAIAKDTVDPKQIGVFQIGFCALFLTAAAFIFDSEFSITLAPGVVGAILFLAVFSTALAFIMQPIAQQYTTSNHVGIIFSLEPVFASAAAFVVFRQTLTGLQLLGAALMLLSVILMNVELPMEKSK